MLVMFSFGSIFVILLVLVVLDSYLTIQTVLFSGLLGAEFFRSRRVVVLQFNPVDLTVIRIDNLD